MTCRIGVAFVVIAAVLGTLVGCAGAPAFHPAWPDAQLELRDDADREQAIDALWITPVGQRRDRVREPIVAALTGRIADAVSDDQVFVAAALLDSLTELWQDDPGAIAKGLASYRPLLRDLRSVFAKSGALEPTVQTLILLAEVDPGDRTQRLAELDEVLAFADDLAVADNGPNATRAQPIALLEQTALALPLPWLVDRYVALQIERQRAVVALLDAHGASMPLVRAHHDLLSAARRIADVLARAGRAAEIHKHLARLATGYGSDRDLAIRAEVVAEQPTGDSYAQLAAALLVDERAPDPAAALAVCVTGLAKFPDNPALLAAGGGAARELGRTDQAIALYERALHVTGEVDAAVALRLGKLYADRIGRLASGGRPAAANEAWRAAEKFTRAGASQHPHSVWRQTAAVAESALGRGLASQGMIEQAKRTLTASISRAPSIDAYETLMTIEVQTDRFADAEKWADEAIAMIGDGGSTGDRYRRAKLERIAGDGLRRGRRTRPATARYLDSLRTWASIGETKDLPRAIAAERELDMGRSMWALGSPDKAVELTMQALEHAPDSEELAMTAVAFLIESGHYRDALDAYHGCLAEPAISEYHKVYMSLWILGEGLRTGERDRLASEYLAARHGDAWYEKLAQLAAGKLPLADLRALATTGPRRAELTFYSAVLGIDPAANTAAGKHKLLEQVVAARLVLDAEYDLARLYLQQP